MKYVFERLSSITLTQRAAKCVAWCLNHIGYHSIAWHCGNNAWYVWTK